jgi:hypothetical protein
MTAIAEKKSVLLSEPQEQPRTVTQFWVCRKVEPDQGVSNYHEYRANLRFTVTANCETEEAARRVCYGGRFILKVRVFDYLPGEHSALTNSFQVLAVVHSKIVVNLPKASKVVSLHPAP